MKITNILPIEIPSTVSRMRILIYNGPLQRVPLPRSHPELNDKPVAVCHSDNPKGTAEISSANYPTRAYG
ncbi:hypothetical protein V6Z12_D13G162300 [Gossypium hirsutum]